MSPPTMIVETPRLRLRPHHADDLEAYLPIWHRGEAGNPAGFALSEEEAWYRLLRFVGHWSHFGYGLFVVEDRTSGRLIGEAGFARFHRGLGPEFDTDPEAAWRVLPHYRGQGIASEAIAAAAGWLEDRGLAARTVCIIDPVNLASIKVAQRIGFREFTRKRYKGATVILFERRAREDRSRSSP
jgi:RimJ/RimL family protein N-acetyltransferase